MSGMFTRFLRFDCGWTWNDLLTCSSQRQVKFSCLSNALNYNHGSLQNSLFSYSFRNWYSLWMTEFHLHCLDDLVEHQVSYSLIDCMIASSSFFFFLLAGLQVLMPPNLPSQSPSSMFCFSVDCISVWCSRAPFYFFRAHWEKMATHVSQYSTFLPLQ